MKKDKERWKISKKDEKYQRKMKNIKERLLKKGMKGEELGEEWKNAPMEGFFVSPFFLFWDISLILSYFNARYILDWGYIMDVSCVHGYLHYSLVI